MKLSLAFLLAASMLGCSAEPDATDDAPTSTMPAVAAAGAPITSLAAETLLRRPGGPAHEHGPQDLAANLQALRTITDHGTRIRLISSTAMLVQRLPLEQRRAALAELVQVAQ